MDIEKIQEHVFKWDIDKAFQMRKNIRRAYKNEKDDIKKHGLWLTLLVLLIKKNKFQNSESEKVMDEIINLTTKIEKDLLDRYNKGKNVPNKMLLDVFYNNTIYKIFYVDSLYRDINYIWVADKFQVLRKNLECNYNFVEWNYHNYMYLLLHRITSNYGTSFWYLWAVTMIITFFFWILYVFLNYLDALGLKEEFGDKPIDFFLYLSIVTITNVWSDVWIEEGNLLIRSLLWVEQILWAILFWIFVMLVAKRL